MSIKELKKSIVGIDLENAAPYLILVWSKNKKMHAGSYPITPEMADELIIVAHDALSRISTLHMSAYTGATLLCPGEEGIWVPSERINIDSELYKLLTLPDHLPTLKATDISREHLSCYAIGIGSSSQDRAFFVKRRARNLRCDASIMGILQGPLKPIKSNIVILERDIDFILNHYGAIVFNSSAFEKYLQDPADTAAQLNKHLEIITKQLPLSSQALSALRSVSSKGSRLRLRIRSITESSYLSSMTIEIFQRAIRAKGKKAGDFIKNKCLDFPSENAEFIIHLLDESTWRGDFSGDLFLTSGKRKEE